MTCFAVSKLELSSTDLIEHDIDVGDSKPPVHCLTP